MDKDKAKQTRATVRYVNLAPYPIPPDWAGIFWENEDPSLHIFTMLHGEAFYETMAWSLAYVESPASLEGAYKFLVLFFLAHGNNDLDLLNQLYHEMWFHFTGGHP
jgi:hypothetical protein